MDLVEFVPRRFVGRRLKGVIGNIALCLTYALGSSIFLFPFLWTVSSSLKEIQELYSFPPVMLPTVPQWVNYLRVFRRAPFSLWAANSFYVAGLGTLGVVFSSSLVAYSLARFEYRGRNLLFVLTLSTMMLPSQVTLIPRYLLFNTIGWLNSFRPLWVPAWFGGGAFYIFLMRQFIMSLPRELDEAAIIDGANYARVYWDIILPLMRPVMATAAVISFIALWSDFLDPLIYLDEKEKFTVAVGLSTLQSSGMGEVWGEPTLHILMAASVMAILPCILLFFSAQRYFVRGIVMSGIKG